VAGLACRLDSPAFGVAHVELFAAGRTMLLPPGIGLASAQISGARVIHKTCSYPASTVDSTGVVWLRRRGLTLGDLFRLWGQPLGRHRMSSFQTATLVRVFVNGQRSTLPPPDIPLRDRDEIVIEIASHVAPHRSYLFSIGAVS
jgi:hypothetical protein